MYRLLIIYFLFLQNILLYSSGFDSPGITFLENIPVLGSIPDKSLLDLTPRKFNFIESTNDSLSPNKACYRMAYGMDFLYILIEVNSDSVIYRDRAYQNGDGFIITIAKPLQNNEETSEFYVLGFSPPVKEQNINQRSFIWYRNIDLSFQSLKTSNVTAIKTKGKVYYQAIIYWKEVYPFHPLFSDSIGFNICFVKARHDDDKIYYFDVLDEKIQSEQSKRLYEILQFDKPSVASDVQFYAELSRNNLSSSDSLFLNVITLSPKDTGLTIQTEIRDKSNSLFRSENYNVQLKQGVNKFSFPVQCGNLVTDNYSLLWSVANSVNNKLPFTLMPSYDYDVIKNEINSSKASLSSGSLNTFYFKLDDVNLRYKNLKSYETCPGILTDINTLISYTEQAGLGKDVLINKEGVFRRGFLSGIDTMYRPYSIRVPVNFDRNNKYPVIVYLHGSGNDDKVAFDMNPLTDFDIIEVYPNGRGTSNLYCSDESQIDIREALNDVIQNYPVDTTKIILSGFSMGGYGVYRTFYETPRVYRALAVFSGHPNLPAVWLGDGYPDFLNEKYLDVFKGVSLFIFHGTQDRNCPFELTLKLVDKFKKSGADVEFVSEETGHSQPSAESQRKFLNWLTDVLK